MDETLTPQAELEIRRQVALNRALGFAIGILEGLRYRVPSNVEKEISQALGKIERLEKGENQ